MGRLPFDSSQIKGAQPSGTPALAHITVSQLAVLIDHALREKLATGLRVVGEISRFTERTHWYFDLKDSGATIPCVMWQSAARKVGGAGFTPEPGQQVLLTGRVEYYQPYGKTQFIADKMEPIGAGALDLAYRRLVEELRALGWLEESRKRPLPMFPRKLAIVTSRSAAALQDVLDTVGRRCPSMLLALADVRVQGEGAAAQIAATIAAIGRHHQRFGIDVILVTRGGGSREDLWSFNERIVAEAIVKSPIPVVAAIGHEIDTTIAELVADLRCATPTQAAMRIAPDAAALRRQLGSVGARLGSSLVRQLKLESERLRGASRHSIFTDPMRMVDEKREDLDTRLRDLQHALRERLQTAARSLDEASRRLNRHRPEAVYARRDAALQHAGARLRAAAHANLARREASLESSARSLDLVGPRNVLKRGYSVTTGADGTIIRSAAQARPGEHIRTRLADGAFGSVVESSGSDATRLRPMPLARPAKRRKPADDPSQPGLF
jgi:exodeoxyribonuclease VII large subunit